MISPVLVALTWEGNDFLSAVSSDRVWSAVKLRVGRALGEASIETVKVLSVKIAADFLLG